MDIVHKYLLWGLLLAGLPVLIHLIMRQKPRHLTFPAFRFLRQRHLINRRKLRLQHLLLLLLRMGVIAALCLALARPKVAAERFASFFSSERPVAAVLVFDTSASMEYSAAGRTRLDEARQRAHELLDELDPGSQVAIFDSAEDAGDGGSEWLSPTLVRSRIDGLRIRPANAPLNRQIDRAVRLLEMIGEGEDALARFLYVFSDRTRACWEQQPSPRTIPEGTHALFVDVGVEQPKDLAIDKVEVVPAIVAPGERLEVRVTARSTGTDFDTELLCQLDSELEMDRPPDRQVLKLAGGQSRVFVFARNAPLRAAGVPPEMTYQLTVRHQTPDALPYNNTHYATFLVRERRRVLTIVGAADKEPPPWKAWQVALDVVGGFQCDLRKTADALRMDYNEWRSYPVVCLFQVAPSAELWQKLAIYVKGGGGLVLVPGGDEWQGEDVKKYNLLGQEAGLLPGTLEKVEKVAADKPFVRWSGFQVRHPIPAFFQKAIAGGDPDFGNEKLLPAAGAFWEVKPPEHDTIVLANYADQERRPALLERSLGRGHVILFTTPLDMRNLDRNRYWHNYWGDSSFGVVLVDQVCSYLAGDSTMPELNYFCGQVPQMVLPSPLAAPPYTLDGPNLALAETNVKAVEGENRVSLSQVVTPGNYVVRDGNKRIVSGCSLNIRSQESDLERVPVEELEAVLGKDTVLQVGRTASVKEALSSQRPPPVELLPWLMMAVLLVLTVEGLLANRFYRRTDPTGAGEVPAVEHAQT